MPEVVIIDAVRTPVGRRNGGLSTVHPADLLGAALVALVERTGIDPADVGQVVSGCVSQVGEQSFNIARTAWLAAGLLSLPRPRPSTPNVDRVSRRRTWPPASSLLERSTWPFAPEWSR